MVLNITIYRLIMELSLENLIPNLNTRFVGQHIIYYPSLPSTMEAAREAGRQGAAEGTVVIVDEQTSGRGRLKRSWISPKGGIALSIILRPSVKHMPQVIMLASLAVTGAIESVTGLKPGIKWPNDVLIEGKKVCGILIENQMRGSSLEFTVVGIGINVNIDPSVYPEIAGIATSLSVELGRPVSRSELLQKLVVEVENLYLDIKAGKNLYQRWRERLVILGKAVQVIDEGKVEQGVAEDVDMDGSLLLRHSDGSLTHIVAGDVTLRPLP
jgi:BirA family transcriptional regulator, biotin operon repressor / biotin---[acetyl-CoA-carboxylase] ligase